MMMIGIANDAEGARRFAVDHFDHMPAHAEWWRKARMRLHWKDIRTINRGLGDLALPEPVILRSANQCVLGHRYEGGWVKVVEWRSLEARSFHALPMGRADAGRSHASCAGIAARRAAKG